MEITQVFGKPHIRYIFQCEKRDMLNIRWGFVVGMQDFSKIMPEAFQCVRGCYLDMKLNNLKCS